MNSIRKSDVEMRILEVCERELKETPYRILDVDARLGASSLIRLFIDKADNESGPTLDEVAELSRKLDPIIEAERFTEGAYHLEVSSPGLDRRLRVAPDFEKEIGREISLNLHESMPGIGANIKGELVKVDLGRINIAQGKKNRKEFEIPFQNIKRANRVWDFEVRKSK
ncbi:MAG: hypothetical protein EBR01_09085 [Proteobacteria bacterium]|nr:hypothetical protein [Pseudomonadota bacterium]